MAKQLKGDINNDGKLSVIDMLTIFRYKLGEISLNAEETERADTYNDGSVTLADALMIHKHITGDHIIDGVVV